MVIPAILPQSKELLYYYDIEANSDLIFIDIYPIKFYLLIKKHNKTFPSWVNLANNFADQLYDALLPYSQIINHTYYPNDNGSDTFAHERLYDLSAFKSEVEGFKEEIRIPLPRRNQIRDGALIRTRPNNIDNYQSVYSNVRGSFGESISFTLPPTSQPEYVIVCYYFGVYRPAYNLYNDFEIPTILFQYKVFSTSTVEARTYELKLKNLPPEIEQQLEQDCDITAGSLTVSSTNGQIGGIVLSLIPPELLNLNISSTFAFIYNHQATTLSNWYGYDYIGATLVDEPFSLAEQGFLLKAYPIDDDLSQYRDSSNRVDGNPLYLPKNYYNLIAQSVESIFYGANGVYDGFNKTKYVRRIAYSQDGTGSVGLVYNLIPVFVLYIPASGWISAFGAGKRVLTIFATVTEYTFDSIVPGSGQSFAGGVIYDWVAVNQTVATELNTYRAKFKSTFTSGFPSYNDWRIRAGEAQTNFENIIEQIYQVFSALSDEQVKYFLGYEAGGNSPNLVKVLADPNIKAFYRQFFDLDQLTTTDGIQVTTFGQFHGYLGVNNPKIHLRQLENNQIKKVWSRLVLLNKKIDEIHACLGAAEFAYSDGAGGTIPSFMHLARKIDHIAKALGISFNLDGTIMSLRQSKHVDTGAVLPTGWSLGQFGRNTGAQSNQNAQQGGFDTEERLGLVYQVKGNRFKTNKATGGQEMTQGGYVLCENLPQYLHVMLQDLDRSLGLQQLGAFAVANPNYNSNDPSFGPSYLEYNGLADGILEIIYTLSDTHRQATGANIGALKAQAISQEVLGALGVPVIEKIIKLEIDGNIINIQYPAFNGAGMTVADLNFLALTNLATLNEN